MGIKITKNRLADIGDKLDYLKSQELRDDIAFALVERGEQIADALYAGTHIEVGTDGVQNGSSKVFASGKGIAYMEYGTGLTGEGTYGGNLPQRPLIFESPKGKRQVTQGWVYYYPNRFTKVLGGWFFGNTFTMGRKAQAQMFYTARELRDEYTSIAKNVIKGDKKV